MSGSSKTMVVSRAFSRSYLLAFPLKYHGQAGTTVEDVQVGIHAVGEGNMAAAELAVSLLQVLFDHDVTEPEMLALLLRTMGHKRTDESLTPAFAAAPSGGPDHAV